VLPATSQLEHTDFHEAYGHNYLQYNAPAIAPLGEAKSNWDVMRLLAAGMGYEEPWLRESPDEIIANLLATSGALRHVTLEQLKTEGTVRHLPPGRVPFADGRFPTPSGKVELRSDALAAAYGVDPLPDYVEPAELAQREPGDDRLVLITGAAHHFVSSSFANQAALVAKERLTPWLEINPEDAEPRGITEGAWVTVGNERGQCRLRAVVTGDVRPGVVVSPKGRWLSLNPDGRGVNWTTSDALGDLAGQSTFHSNLVHVRMAEAPK